LLQRCRKRLLSLGPEVSVLIPNWSLRQVLGLLVVGVVELYGVNPKVVDELLDLGESANEDLFVKSVDCLPPVINLGGLVLDLALDLVDLALDRLD
jgi:hypothetical protein